MRRKFMITASVTGSLALLWTAFSLGAYKEWRTSNAFMANQVIHLRQMAVRGETPQAIAEEAGMLAKRFESDSNQATFFGALKPSVLPAVLSSSTENDLWRYNHEALARYSPLTKAQ